VKIKTIEDIENKKVFIGKILDFIDETVSIETEGAEYLIPYNNIEKANLELDF
jgi:ribosome maturation factor RimP